MLDDLNVLNQRDPQNALGVAAQEFEQVSHHLDLINPAGDDYSIQKVIVAGMGGSALAALLAKSWLSDKLSVPFDIVRDYELPGYIDSATLVIASSYSGNTEETLECLSQARSKNAKVAVIAAGGRLVEVAGQEGLSCVVIPAGLQPRMAVLLNLRALVEVFEQFKLVDTGLVHELEEATDWLKQETQQWLPTVPSERNYAKQLAMKAAGKTPVFYGGRLTGPVAYKWKISWNENAKNVAFWNVYPEANHNEFIGWTSHPVDKPFAVFDLKSSFEHAKVLRRFEVSDKLLSGRRPSAIVVQLQGNTPLQQLLWGSILADFASIYVAILNGVNPTPVELIEKLKQELAQ